MLLHDAKLHLVRAGFEHAYVVADEKTGLLAIESSYGIFNHVWPPRHRRSDLPIFLARLGMDYFMSKARGNGAQIFDLDATVKAMKDVVLEARRAANIDKFRAREAWDAIEDVKAENPQTSEHCSTLIFDVADGETLPEILGSEWYELLATTASPECVGFWKTLWPSVITSLHCHAGLENPFPETDAPEGNPT
jgi:hypothetical protein